MIRCLQRGTLFIFTLFSFFNALPSFSQTDATVTITTTGNYYVHQGQEVEFLVQVGNIGTAPIINGALQLSHFGNITQVTSSINCITAPGYAGESVCPDLVSWNGTDIITGLNIPEGAVLQFNIRYYVNPIAPLEQDIGLIANFTDNGAGTETNLTNNAFTLSLKTKPVFTRRLRFKVTANPASLSGSNTFDLLFVRTSPYKWRDDTLSVPVTLSAIDSRLGSQRTWGDVSTNAAQDEVYISFDYSNPSGYWSLPPAHELSPFHPMGTDHNLNELLRTAQIEHMGFFQLELGAFPYQIYTSETYLDLTYLLFDAKPYFQNETGYLRAYDFLGVVNNYQRIGDLDISLYPRNVEPDSFRCFFETPVYYRYTAVKSSTEFTPPPTDGTARVRIHGYIDLYYSDNVLPVELSAFDVAQQQKNILLKWSTATEQNNKGFYIEYSTNGKDWTNLDFVESAANNGNSQSLLHYSYLHKNIPGGEHYYRLKQVDTDNEKTYSSIKSIKVIDNAKTIDIYPNPANATITIRNVSPGALIVIYNSSGTPLLQYKAQHNTETIPITSLPKGVYYLKTIQDQQVTTNSFIKQ